MPKGIYERTEKTRAKMREVAKKRDPSTFKKCSLPMEKNPAWKGGRLNRRDGYIFVKQPSHPFAGFNGYVMEHRLVMEKRVGRYLQSNEIVHHRDGNRSNNDDSNLILLDKNKHQTSYLAGFQEGIAQGFAAGFLCACMRRNK